jgi:AcrR family transcriptional regulator
MSRRAGLDHEAVVEAAAKLVDEEGIDQLSLGRLAERLGIRTPSLYNHVAGLPGLKHDLALYSLRDLLNHATRATIGKSRAEAIIGLADAFRSYAMQTPGRYTLTQQAPDPGDRELQLVAQQVIDVVQAILVPYKLSDEDAIHAIRGLRSIVHGFVSLEVIGGFGLPVDLDASFHWLINVFVSGLDRSAKTGDQKHVTGNMKPVSA